MSDYKRRTIRRNGIVQYTCDGCPLYASGMCGDGDCEGEFLDYVADLEDKIESGLMVELPCKVGDTVYFIEYFCNHKGCSSNRQSFCCGCREMLERERIGEKYVISQKKFKLEDLNEVNKTLFTTQEAAEARFKELQRGRS